LIRALFPNKRPLDPLLEALISGMLLSSVVNLHFIFYCCGWSSFLLCTLVLILLVQVFVFVLNLHHDFIFLFSLFAFYCFLFPFCNFGSDFNALVFFCCLAIAIRAFTPMLSMWACKNISHIQVLVTNFFPTTPIKLKLGLQVSVPVCFVVLDVNLYHTKLSFVMKFSHVPLHCHVLASYGKFGRWFHLSILFKKI